MHCQKRKFDQKSSKKWKIMSILRFLCTLTIKCIVKNVNLIKKTQNHVSWPTQRDLWGERYIEREIYRDLPLSTKSKDTISRRWCRSYYRSPSPRSRLKKIYIFYNLPHNSRFFTIIVQYTRSHFSHFTFRSTLDLTSSNVHS